VDAPKSEKKKKKKKKKDSGPEPEGSFYQFNRKENFADQLIFFWIFFIQIIIIER